MNRTCVVSFMTQQGQQYAHVTAAATVFEAVRTAMRWFADPHWRGLKPTVETIFEVSLIGDERRWRVLAGKARSGSG
jgi:hypothetical protein